MKIKKFKIPKLPRKLKKKIYGKRGRRKHFCLELMESKEFNRKIDKIISSDITHLSTIELMKLYQMEINMQIYKWQLENEKN